MFSGFDTWIRTLAMRGLTKKKRRNHTRTSNFARKLRIEALEDRRLLAITVNTFVDELDGDISTDGDVSLRDAVILAPANETIDFDPSIMNGKTINLLASLGEIAILKSLTIDASMLPDGLTIDAGGGTNGMVGNGDGFRIFNIFRTSPNNTSPLSVEMIGLTLTGGDVSGDGGAIRARESLVLRDSTITGNHATGDGGGLFAYANKDDSWGNDPVDFLNVDNLQFLANTAGNDGGGLHVTIGPVQRFSAPEFLVDIVDSTFTDNTAISDGGALYMFLTEEETASVRNISAQNNTADRGGGLHIHTSGSPSAKTKFSLLDSSLTGNHAIGGSVAFFSGSGGGIFVDQGSGVDLTISGSTFSGNGALLHGGGAFLCGGKGSTEDTMSVINSTFSGNQSINGQGGGIWFGVGDGFLDFGAVFEPVLTNSTVTGNSSASGGGVYSQSYHPYYTSPPVPGNAPVLTQITNTIISGNVDHNSNANNLWGKINTTLSQYNLVGPASSNNIIGSLDSTNIIQTDNDPKLSPLANHGGPTKTHRPLTGSPAIDSGSNALSVDPLTMTLLTNDQRGTGFPRPFDIPNVNNNANQFTVDIGAHEVGLAKVADVMLDNPTWGRDPHSFAEVIPLGEQLRPFATQNVNTIQIKFSDAIRKRVGTDGAISDIQNNPTEGNTLMQLKQTIRNSNGSVANSTILASAFAYDPQTNVATWTYNTPLADGKYAIHLFNPIGSVGAEAVTGIVDLAGNAMDAEWNNAPTGQPDQWQTHPKRPFATGNGTPGSTNDEFRFHFALLAGDYDGDGKVEHDAESITGDGNGDNIDDTTDTTVGSLGTLLPLLQFFGADLNDDEKVDGLDLAIWQTGYGGSVAGDVDGDGDTDGADFLLWQRVYGTYSVWSDGSVYQSYAEAMAAALGVSLEDITVGLTPQVLNVIISGSQSTHTPFSFDSADGSGAQLASVPVGAADTISIVFSENVNVGATSLIVVGLRTASVPQVVEFSYDAATHTASWRLESWAMGDQYLLYLADSITDVDGNFLDGEWTNPASISTTSSLVSTFPSGDGVSGGSFKFVMTLMPDVNQDNIVNYTDFYTTYYGELYGVVGDFSNGDFNGNGIVDQADVDLVDSLMWLSLQNIQILSDMNADGKVDGTDLGIISNNHGMTGATWADGDLNGDQVVDDSDLDLAFAQWGLDFDWVA